jgi:hypothetical protein
MEGIVLQMRHSHSAARAVQYGTLAVLMKVVAHASANFRLNESILSVSEYLSILDRSNYE